MSKYDFRSFINVMPVICAIFSRNTIVKTNNVFVKIIEKIADHSLLIMVAII